MRGEIGTELRGYAQPLARCGLAGRVGGAPVCVATAVYGVNAKTVPYPYAPPNSVVP